VQHLRESILVVDGTDRIRLINESAATMLGAQAWPGAAGNAATPAVPAGHGASTAKQETGTFTAADGSRLIRPFRRAGRNPARR
jgi:sensor histidine kinase regulating citrate/malate metabolism